MNLGKRILSVKGNSYMRSLRQGKAWEAIDAISKDYDSIIDSILDDSGIRNLKNTELSKIVKLFIYSMSNYGHGDVYYDYDDIDTFYDEYRENIKLNGYFLPEEISVEEFIFDGKEIDPHDFGGKIMDINYGELTIPDSVHTIMSDADICADMTVRIGNADDLSTFLEVCYDTFVDLFKDLSHQEELDAARYAPYTILTDYISTMLFTIADEVVGDIIKMYAEVFPEFKQFLEFENDYVYSYPKSITECITKDELGMAFLYNYRGEDDISVALVCICMMFKNYLERRIII